jgi:flavin reductase (DIM6/NTAB) family NADH-FMN oxidoreductase RutF
MDQREYRDALGSFATGVAVVTALDGAGAPWGLTANSFTSVALEPPLVSVCIAARGRVWPVLSRAHRFAVNVLAGDQTDLAFHFAGKAENRFEGRAWSAHPDGAPVLPGMAAWFDCAVHDRVAAGDHMILLGRVLRYGRDDRPPLACCRGAFFAVEPRERAHG